MKISLLTRNLTTVYTLLIALSCLTVGCIRKPAEVVSQSDKRSYDPLVSSKNSSSFNYFQSKKQSSSNEAVAKVKVNEPSSVDHRAHTHPEDQTGRVEIVADSTTSPRYVSESLKKPVRKPVENWRSKSLIESAKKYPSKVAESYHQKSDRIKLASSSITQGISSGIRRISGKVSDPLEQGESEKKKNTSNLVPSSRDQFRSGEVSRFFDQTTQKDDLASSQISQLENDLRQSLEHAKPTFEGVNDEMRRLQVSSILDRAKRELKQENYEYAAFLAEQALESSYQGHIAFGPEEESPQMLLQRIKKSVPANLVSEVQKIEHTNPRLQSNGSQKVKNFQFSPSPVHPFKRRSVMNPKQTRPQQSSTGEIQELPLIVPRFMGTDRQQPARPTFREPVPGPPGVSLDTPAFEPYPTRMEIPAQENTRQQESDSGSQPTLGLELEEVPDEPPAKVRLSGPEPIHQEQVHDIDDNTSKSPGPQLMLPKLPTTVPQDLTSQSVGHNQTHQTTVLNHSEQTQGKQSVPVKFRSKMQETSQDIQTPDMENHPIAEKSKSAPSESGLTLDEIEWELDEKKSPERESQWSGMSTLLLIVGGAIVLLLSSIIVILLRRSNPSI